MRDYRGPTFALSAAAFLVGAALLAAFVALALASSGVRGAAALGAPVVLVGLFVGPLAALVVKRFRAGPSAPAGERTEAEGKRDAVLAGLAIPGATLAFVLVLLDAWVSARSNGSYTGGLVPVSDAGAYFGGAERLLVEGTLDGWNSRRPLNAALLVTRIALADGELRGALLLQAALLGATTTMAARALAKDFGAAAGLLFFAGLYVFGSIFVATTMSESLGLSLGALSFALLWHGMRTRRFSPMAAGFALCAMALNARSGAFLVLPCLLVWAALTQAPPRTDDRVDVVALLAAVVGTASGFGVNALVAALYAGASGGTHSNFSYTLYGLAMRGAGWERAIADFPELRGMGDAEAGAFVYARAVDVMHVRPLDFVVGLGANVECFILSMSEKLSLGLLDGHAAASFVYALVWGAGAVYLVVRTFRIHGADRGLLMIAAATLGVALSVPVIYMDGRERVFAASVPFVLAGAAIAVASLGRRAVRAEPRSALEHARWANPVLRFSTALALTAMAGPRIAHGLFAPPPFAKGASDACAPGLTPIAAAGRDGLPSVSLDGIGSDASLPPGAPHVEEARFKSGIARDVNLGTSPLGPALSALHAGETFASVFDRDAHRVRHVVMPSRELAAVTGPVTLCTAGVDPSGGAAIVHVVSVTRVVNGAGERPRR